MNTHTEWLNNEYTKWAEALNECTLDNFKQHPMVRRMIGLDDDHKQFIPLIEKLDLPWEKLQAIDQIGNPPVVTEINGVRLSGVMLRYIYYAVKVMNNMKACDGKCLLEIGGGYGGFISTLILITDYYYKAPAFAYIISDIHGVNEMQVKNILQAINKTAINPNVIATEYENAVKAADQIDYLTSFYALGEFDEQTKQDYIHNVISKCPHGFIIWNAHSGADDTGIELIKKYHPTLIVQDENPLTSPGNKQLTW